MNWQLDQCYKEGCKLERELAAVTEQRDRLMELLLKLDMTLEAQCFSPTGYTRTEIHKALAAVKGGPQ